MHLTTHEPWRLFDLIHRDLDRLTGRRDPEATGHGDDGRALSDWLPAVDIVEEKDRFVLHADVPGVNPDDIDVSMENGILSLAGSRRSETSESAGDSRRIERTMGTFYRRFTLPDTADADNIAAKCSYGTLEVTIPKQPRVLAKRITVRTG